MNLKKIILLTASFIIIFFILYSLYLYNADSSRVFFKATKNADKIFVLSEGMTCHNLDNQDVYIAITNPNEITDLKKNIKFSKITISNCRCCGTTYNGLV
ncbi:hypothetical protein AAEX28_12080 [Lentisphaerota bacterium WC36G]